jgi:hypothetical protein
MPMELKTAGLALIAAAILSASPVRQGLAQGEAPTFAVAEIQYVDTSGEVIDQSADHLRRLREFEASLRTDLAAGGKVRKIGRAHV